MDASLPGQTHLLTLSMALLVLLVGCGDAPPAKPSPPELLAIKTARAAIAGYLVAAKNDPLDAHDTAVMVPAYERGLTILQAAEDSGLKKPELLVATVATLPDGAWLELLWLDTSFHVSGVSLRKVDQPTAPIGYPGMVRWTDVEKQTRKDTAYRHEAFKLKPVNLKSDVADQVQTKDGRSVINFPREWLTAKLEASLLYNDGASGEWITVTTRTVEEEPK